MSIRLSVDPPDGPSSQGTGPVVELRVKNEGPDLVILDEARSDGPDDEVVRWKIYPEGVVLYDAMQDEYRHLSLPQTRACVPVWSGAVPPRATAASYMRLRTMAAGPRTARIVVRGHRVPLHEVPARIYTPAEAMHASMVNYVPAKDAGEARGGLIARLHGAEPVEASVEVALAVDVDPAATAALEQAGAGARLAACVDRLRAWVIETGEATVVVQRERQLRAARGAIDPSVWRHLDDRRGDGRLYLMLLSPEARALRDAGQLPVTAQHAQLVLPAHAVWELLERVVERRLNLSVGRHTPIQDGLILR